MLPSTLDVMTGRHDVIETCNAITGAIGHRNNNPNVNRGFHHTGKSLEHVTHMLQKYHDVMTWRHVVIVTCKTISGTQHINLIPNLFPEFYYMGRSLASWQVVMTSSWHIKLYQALFNIETWLQIKFVMTSRFLSNFVCCMHATTFNYYPWKLTNRK